LCFTGEQPVTKETGHGRKTRCGNLSNTTSNDDLRQLFTQAGAVALVAVTKDRDTGHALITLVTRADTRKAISMFNAYRLDERSMTVNLARPRLVHTSGRPHGFQP
jgi:RNA recognition motif-containing protein